MRYFKLSLVSIFLLITILCIYLILIIFQLRDHGFEREARERDSKVATNTRLEVLSFLPTAEADFLSIRELIIAVTDDNLLYDSNSEAILTQGNGYQFPRTCLVGIIELLFGTNRSYQDVTLDYISALSDETNYVNGTP